MIFKLLTKKFYVDILSYNSCPAHSQPIGNEETAVVKNPVKASLFAVAVVALVCYEFYSDNKVAIKRWIKAILVAIVLTAVIVYMKGYALPITADNDRIAGFWLGILHGMISPISLLASIFTDKVGIYEAHNTGFWYNLPFLLSAAGAFKVIASWIDKIPDLEDAYLEARA